MKVAVCAAGSNLILVASNKVENQSHNSESSEGANTCIGWGQPVAGKIGFEGDARSSTNPKFMTALSGLRTVDISCGYGHVCYVVQEVDKNGSATDNPVANSSSNSSSKKGSAANKAAAAAAAADVAGTVSSFPLLVSLAGSKGAKKRASEEATKKAPAKKGKK